MVKLYLLLLVSIGLFGLSVRGTVTSEKIFNGRDAARFQFPWMIWIMTRSGSFNCGGTLIAPTWVLTAAHCVRDVQAVIVGDYNITDVLEGEQAIPPKRIISHPGYPGASIDNDVALIKLSFPANISAPYIQAIPRLASRALEKRVYKERPTCLLSGWGYMKNTQGRWMLAEVLQKLKINLVNYNRCSKLIGSPRPTGSFCELAVKGDNAGGCPGDSGSPVVCKINDKWTLLGVHSYGFAYNGCTYLKGAQRVAFHRNWIKQYVSLV